MDKRTIFVFTALTLLFIFTGIIQGWSTSLNILNIGLISAVLALGLNIQWGYAGLFNAGVMAFTALGAIACVLISMPWVTNVMISNVISLQETAEINQQVINQLQKEIPLRLDAERKILLSWFIGGATGILSWFMNRNLKNILPKKIRFLLITVILIAGLLLFRTFFEPAKEIIESTGFGDNSKYLGGLGLPIFFSWIVGGIFAVMAAWIIGHIALGLRSDYLAIATLGISEIVIALLKNENWLTRGTLNVAGLPSPIPTALSLQGPPYSLSIDSSLIIHKILFALVITAFLSAFLWLCHKSLNSPWGRMMRAIRDNEESALAMGKNVVKRHRQIFMLGSFLLGVGGAMLATHVLQFDPGQYRPLRYTFVIYVMVIVGGSGNNLGSIIGGILIWFVWVQAEPAAYWIFQLISENIFLSQETLSETLMSRAPQMRTLVMGIVLLTVLRFAPRGLLPEKLGKK